MKEDAGRGRERGGDLYLDLGANLKAHRMLGEGLDGFPDDSAYRPARRRGEWRR